MNARNHACLLGFCALVLIAGCRGAASSGTATTRLAEPHPEAMRTPGWLEFTDLSLHTNDEETRPLEPYVRGSIEGGIFHPSGPIVGSLEAPAGRRVIFMLKGWLDLRTRAFFLEGSKRQKTPPYVEGSKDRETGGFHPTAAIVHESGSGG